MSNVNDRRAAHISQRYHFDLDAVKTHLLEMGGVVEKQLVRAIEALLGADSGTAQDVCDQDQRVNQLELAIDEECARILACRQPAAGDLRLIIAIGKVNTDLERIGDEAVKVAKQAIVFSEVRVDGTGLPELRAIGDQVCDMLSQALDAMVRLDVELALAVARQDRQVDDCYDGAVKAMTLHLQQHPDSLSHTLTVLWALRALERVGDHSRNIAEYVVYLVKGADVRHLGLQHMAEQVYRA